MSQGQLHVIVRHLRRVAGDMTPQATDRQLLERFRAARDEAAFSALVERHGPLVWGVCRRVLGHQQDAEDAFQATFLVLARKAGAVCWRDSVHNWLYEVASRLAAEARVRAARRRLHEARAAARAPTEALPDHVARELGALLDEELRRLPPRLRAPLLLCYLEGRTGDQAARQLGWSLRTLQRRLAQGRELLRLRLTRRGVTLSAALLGPSLTRGADVPALLAITTAKIAVAFAAGSAAVPAKVAALAHGILRGMVMSRMRFAVLAMLVVGTVAGVGMLARQPFGGTAAAEPPAQAAGKDGASPKEAPRKPTPFAYRVWTIMEVVRQKHPEPPARDDMLLGAAQGLYKETKEPVPDGLKARVAKLESRDQLDAFLKAIWPRGADEARTEALQEAALEGLFATLPGRGVFLPPDQAKAIEANSANRYVGIGIQIRIHPDEKLPQIVTPVGNGPARKAGVEPDDLIVEVGGKSTRDVPLVKVVEWLRGEEGTGFTMVVRTPGAKETRTLKFTRTVVPFESAMGYRRAPGDDWEFRPGPQDPIAYVRLLQLRSSTPHELRQLERRLRAEGARAVVLDLRDGGGSDFHSGTLVASALLDGQLMWNLRGAGNQLQPCRAGQEGLFRDWPMAVLINDRVDQVDGAVAAALQDAGRAVLVGEMTRNSGFVNSLIPLPDGDGALSIRIGRLERAAKDRAWPVRPDHEVSLTKEQREAVGCWLVEKGRLQKPGSAPEKAPPDPQLDKAVELLRAALKKQNEGR